VILRREAAQGLKPSAGLEPATPSLPWRTGGGYWVPSRYRDAASGLGGRGPRRARHHPRNPVIGRAAVRAVYADPLRGAGHGTL
jgi:hypothetical protein